MKWILFWGKPKEKDVYVDLVVYLDLLLKTADGAEVRDALLNSRQYWIISGQLANHVSNDWDMIA